MSNRASSPPRKRRATGPLRRNPESTIRYQNVNEYLKANLKSIECPQHGAGGLLRPDGIGRTGHRVKCQQAGSDDYHKFCIYKLAAYIPCRPSDISPEEWAQCLEEYPKGASFKDNMEEDLEASIEESYDRTSYGSQPIISRAGGDTTHSVSQTMQHLKISNSRPSADKSGAPRLLLDLTPKAMEEDRTAQTNQTLAIILNAIKDLSDRFEVVEREVEDLKRKVARQDPSEACEMKQAIETLNEQVKRESEKREEILNMCKKLVPARQPTRSAPLSYSEAATSQGEWKTVNRRRLTPPSSPVTKTAPAKTRNQFAVLGERPALVEVEGFPLKVLRPETRPISMADVVMGTPRPSTKPKTRTFYVRSRRRAYNLVKVDLEASGIPRYAILELCFLGDNLLSLITHEEYAGRIEELYGSLGVLLPDFDPLNPIYRELFGDRAEANMSRALGSIAFRASETQKCKYTGKREAIVQEYTKYAQLIAGSSIKLSLSPEAIGAMKAYVERADKPPKGGPRVLREERQLANCLRPFLSQGDTAVSTPNIPADSQTVSVPPETAATYVVEISSDEADVEM
jgi:hypothetical protein